jgi:3-phytase
MFLSVDDDAIIYSFALAESTAKPAVGTLGTAGDAVTGLAVYISNSTSEHYLFAALESAVAVYRSPFELLGNLELAGVDDPEIQGLSIYQAKTAEFTEGALVYAIEGDGVLGFGVSSLAGALEGLGVTANTKYDPRTPSGPPTESPICSACSGNGFCQGPGACACFAGFTGPACQGFHCADNCSGHGQCVGANICQCEAGWGGLHCSFLLVEPTHETDANGGDGDDPAIWISPVAPEHSRIITTIKSEQGAGFGVFDLTGQFIQHFAAGQPNNVHIIYGFQAGPRKIDLAYAACRDDNTLW